jgi:hypothetical protein
MHQYRIDTNVAPVIERWGGVPTKKHTFDEDLVDATVVQSSGVKTYTFHSPVPVNGSPELVGIEDVVNHRTPLQMGTLLDASGNEYAASGNVSAPQLPTGAFASAINNLGQIVGTYPDPDIADNGISHGFIYTPGKSASIVTLDYPEPTTCTYPTSINDAGWVVGVYQDMQGPDGFQYCGYLGNPQHCVLWKPPIRPHNPLTTSGAPPTARHLMD